MMRPRRARVACCCGLEGVYAAAMTARREPAVRGSEGGLDESAGPIDVTEREQAAQALRASEERYARAMEGSDAGHWDWNIATDELFVSERAREMLALPAGPMPATGKEVMALVPMHPADRAGMWDRLSIGIEAGTHERDYRVIPRGGEQRWLRARGKVFRDSSGTAVCMTGSLMDVTGEK